jgi:hypothetical protein
MGVRPFTALILLGERLIVTADKMSEEDIFRLLKDAIVCFNAEGNNPKPKSLFRQLFKRV